MLFDNLGITQITGPVLEETHYYPRPYLNGTFGRAFGLTMSGISTTAPLKLEGKRKFNGIELNHKEFSDGSGLDLYTAKFRGLDPQIGRWWQIDPKPNTSLSPYAAMDLNPILNFDPLGDTSWPIKNKWNNKTIQNYRNYAANAWKSYQKNGIKCTCEDFALGVVIDFASQNNLPLIIVNGSGTYSAASNEFNNTKGFKKAVMTSTAASDLKANTSKISLSSLQPGDLFGLKNANGNFHHIQLITSVNGKNVVIHQGNFINKMAVGYNALSSRFARRFGIKANINNPYSGYYIGSTIQTGNYNFSKGVYFRQGDYKSVGSAGYGTMQLKMPNIQFINSLNIAARRWNFKSWNN